MPKPLPINLGVVLLAVVVAWLAGRASNASDEWRARAEAAEAVLPVLEQRVVDARASVDSIALELAQREERLRSDSASWARRIAAERDRGLTLATRTEEQLAGLRAALSDSTAALLDSLVATYDARIEAVLVEVAVLEEERATLWNYRDTQAEQIARLTNYTENLEAQVEQQAVVIDAWRRAASPSLLERLSSNVVPIAALGAAVLVLVR